MNLVGAANGQVYPLFLTTSSGSSSWNFGFGQNYDGNIVGLQWSNSQTYSSSNYNSANPSSARVCTARRQRSTPSVSNNTENFSC